MMKHFLPGVLAMAIIVVASNILVQFLLGDWLTWGAVTYPFAFLVTDLMNRFYGPRQARRVVLAGFVTGVLCSLIGSQIEGQFGPLVSVRVAIGSGSAFLLAQMVDVAIFDRLRSGSWWRAPLVSSLIGSCLDSTIFFSMAFATQLAFIWPADDVSWANETLPVLGVGPMAPLWVSLAIADSSLKFALSLIALLPFKAAVTKLSPKTA
ncbi:queuosine precursor transporter [Thioclava sp. GXIMD4216]|uniref:Probable queuosine precursor transporter n=2 Tax=Paracoccaceae TaxID=31989 RepID=A0ABZ1E4K5_9RHOB|nr:queuosine precursor transporter [Thioclava sp. FTW29]